VAKAKADVLREHQAAVERLAVAERLAAEAALEMSRPEVWLRDYQLDKLVGCEVRITRDLFLRMKNPSETVDYVCEMVGRAVQEKVFEYARMESRVFGVPARQHPVPTLAGVATTEPQGFGPFGES
jgi:hypothetical protein